MILCSCHAVSDARIRAAIENGAASFEEVSARCSGAGTCCGACRPMIESMLAAPIAPALLVRRVARARPRPVLSEAA